MITMSELAKLAGVSQSTISRCLNNHPSISIETKERIQKIALQYGYVELKQGRRTIFSGGHRIFGIMVEDRPFFDDLYINYAVSKLISVASQKNYYMIRLPISSNDPGSMDRLREFLKLSLIDGFIIMHRNYDEQIHNYLKDLGIPHVYLLHCSRVSLASIDMVDSDNYIGGYLGCSHLIGRGHTDIATFTCPYREFEDRTNGYLQALADAGLSSDPKLRIMVDQCSYQSAYNQAARNIKHLSRATAVYVQSDIMAAGVINALQHGGLRIPDDISVVGSDGYKLGEIFNPQFDSVAHPMLELAGAAISRLIDLTVSAREQTPRQIILRPYIIERGSVKDLSKA